MCMSGRVGMHLVALYATWPNYHELYIKMRLAKNIAFWPFHIRDMILKFNILLTACSYVQYHDFECVYIDYYLIS